MILVPLTKNKFAMVDDNCEHFLTWKWQALTAKNIKNFYAVRMIHRVPGCSGAVLMHHAVIGMPLNRKFVVDHINGDPLDNRLSNLRIVSQRDNMANQKRKREGKTSSKYVGVHWSKRDKRWQANIRIGGKNKNLGLFTSEAAAAKKYQEAKLRLEQQGMIPNEPKPKLHVRGTDTVGSGR